MAWVAVDHCGREDVFENKPTRCVHSKVWEDGIGDYYDQPVVELPQGSILKLIGKKLTWQDEPIELK